MSTNQKLAQNLTKEIEKAISAFEHASIDLIVRDVVVDRWETIGGVHVAPHIRLEIGLAGENDRL